MNRSLLTVGWTTAYLVVFVVLTRFELPEWIHIGMFMLAPFLLLWMVWRVLTDRSSPQPELGDKEFGYAEKPFL